ncbi:MAG: winged helix-turn-helix transcriptional regulator [Acidobacteria bacterium]|nr:winged helix-turn-helix transcriptional regulator [Acidobacteriota bacterium]
MKTKTDVTITHYRALSEFRYQIHRYLTLSDEAAKAAGLHPRQYQLLLALKGLPEEMEPTISTLAARLQIRHHSAVELISRSEIRGLVRRERSELHRSYVFVRITRKGEAMLRKLVAARRKELRKSGPILVKMLQKLTRSQSSTHGLQEEASRE